APARRDSGKTPVPAPAPRHTPPPVLVAAGKTPPPVVVRDEHPVIAIRGTADIARVTAEITARLGRHDLKTLTIDLDHAELIPDDVALVIKRARAAAAAEGVDLVVRATKPG